MSRLQEKDLILYICISLKFILIHQTQSLTINHLSNLDRERKKDNSYVFDYRTINGENRFVQKLDNLSDDSYMILPCANKGVIKSYGEIVASEKILELQMFDSLNSDGYSIYKGTGTINRILKEDRECGFWEIPITFVSGRADDICKAIHRR